MRTRGAVAVLLLTLTLPAVAPPARAGEDESAALLAVVERFFDAMARGDVESARAVTMPEGRFYSVREEDGAPVVRTFTNEESFARWGEGERLLERIWDAEVRVDGRIATVRAPYDFHVGDRFSHCGIDVLDLVETAEGWKLTGGVYTVETEGCPVSPLGPPAAAPGSGER
jgi:hypothetical protein